jgi:2-polyprenyl-3-methyl-5-hydroxy-6-metoxy-1,4-benzoquinol methylase
VEWKLFDGDFHEYATAEWYEPRESAHHLEEEGHVHRLEKALEHALSVENNDTGATTLSDLGCGDGGFLQALRDSGSNLRAWGYDLAPNNIQYAQQVRGVDARYTDFKNDDIVYGDITVMTEVLEHLVDPYDTLESLPSRYIIASSPNNETDKSHYEFHLWAWDAEGYTNLFNECGWNVIHSDSIGWSQVVLATRQ